MRNKYITSYVNTIPPVCSDGQSAVGIELLAQFVTEQIDRQSLGTLCIKSPLAPGASTKSASRRQPVWHVNTLSRIKDRLITFVITGLRITGAMNPEMLAVTLSSTSLQSSSCHMICLGSSFSKLRVVTAEPYNTGSLKR